MWDYVPVPSNICDCCIDRLAAGEKAACEHHCLGQCLEVLPVAEIAQRLIEKPSSKTTCFIP